MSFRRVMLLTALLAGGAYGPAAWAQGNPSADSIIQSLTPRGGMGGGTRGIRPVAPSAAPAEPATPSGPRSAAPAAAPRHSVAPAAAHAVPGVTPAAAPGTAAPSVNLTVQFPNNSAELTPAAVRTLTELGRALSSNALGTYRFRIEGHTDTVGTAESNKTLSERRAQAVVTFLVSRFSIDSSRLDPVGMGEEGLLVQTPGSTPEPRNRRVQVINLGA